MRLLKLLILTSSIVLFGCATPTPPSMLTVPSERKVIIDPTIMKDCGKLVDNMPEGSSFEDVLVVKGMDANTFAECKKLNESKKRIITEYLLNDTTR